MAVRPGYRGSFQIVITTAASTLSLKRMNIRETVETHDTTGTASSLDAANLAFTTRIQGKKTCRINIGAQYGMDGAGDPPNFTGINLYGTKTVTAQAGDTVAGTFLAEEYGNSLDESGTIDYELNLISNGTYTRTTNP